MSQGSVCHGSKSPCAEVGSLLRKTCKIILSWCLAFVVAATCANVITFFYRSSAGSISRENAFSGNIRTPNSRIVRGSEGYGVNYVDENGYVNIQNIPLRSNYILFMGSSHLEGLQVMQSQNMVTLLNQMISKDERTIYNLGTAGYTLPLIIKGFQAGIQEFPNSSAVIIELSQMDYTSDSLIAALDQTQFDPTSTGKALVESQSNMVRIRNLTLEILPVISLMREQFESIDLSLKGAFGLHDFLFPQQPVKKPDAGFTNGENAIEPETNDSKIASLADNPSNNFSSALQQSFALLRAEYSNPIIILYHPSLAIQPDGTARINRDDRYYDTYRDACAENGFIFLDVGEAFLAAYEKDYSLPYGFSNTTMGKGHLNQQGHRIIAEELYRTLMEIQSKGKH